MKIAVVDSHFLCYRALFTTGHFEHQGQKTGVVYGFLNQVLTMASKVLPDIVVFAWDSPVSKRREIRPEYKRRNDHNYLTEQEQAEKQENYRQFNLLRKTLPRLGFPNVFIQEGFEADDLIAKIVMDERYSEHEFTVVSGDDDLLQLLDYCEIFYLSNVGKSNTPVWKNRDWFTRKYEIAPREWVKVKQIGGCKSDNVTGIKGVGEKKAIQYLRGLMKPSSKIYKRIQSFESQQLINENRELVKLPFEGTAGVKLDLVETRVDMKALIQFCKKLGIRRLVSLDKQDEWEAFLNGV